MRPLLSVSRASSLCRRLRRFDIGLPISGRAVAYSAPSVRGLFGVPGGRPRRFFGSTTAPSSFHPRRLSSPPPLALRQSLKHQYRLLDVFSFRPQIRKDLVDVPRFIITALPAFKARLRRKAPIPGTLTFAGTPIDQPLRRHHQTRFLPNDQPTSGETSGREQTAQSAPKERARSGLKPQHTQLGRLTPGEQEKKLMRRFLPRRLQQDPGCVSDGVALRYIFIHQSFDFLS
jgi:hypothetical protein